VITPPDFPVSDGLADEAMRARIVRRLARFGAGPAASFRDACLLMDGDPPVASDAYLVGRLVRELESSVRAVLLASGARRPQEPREPREPREPEEPAAPDGRMGVIQQAFGRLVVALKALIRAVFQPEAPAETPLAEPPPARPSRVNAHRAEIRAILDSLEIAYDSDTGQTWLGYASLLHSRESARGLGMPRPVEQEFRRRFADLEAMLDVVLGRHEARYLATVARLDALAQVEQPADEHASELRRTLSPDPVTMEHFFSRLASPAWLGPLKRQEFFAEPPEPVADVDGPCWMRRWPALRYLVRIAGQDPALAVGVALGIPPTTNQVVNADFVDLALEVPAAEGVRLLPRITRDLTGPYEAVRAGRFGELVVHLVEAERPGPALDLARVLWGLAPSTADSGRGGEASGDPRTRIDYGRYAQTLRTCLPPLVAAGGLDVLDAMAGLLNEAITRTSSSGQVGEDFLDTDFAMATNWPVDTASGAKTALARAVRDAAEQLVLDRRAELADALQCLDSRPGPIFRRLALHLVRQFGAGYPEEVARRLTDAATIKDPSAEREFLLLAGDYFARLSAEQQDFMLSVIDQGPDTDAWAAEYAAQAGREPSGELIDRWVAEWTRDRLGALQPALSPQRLDSYRKLVLLVGEPVPVDKARATDITGLGGRHGANVETLVDRLRTQPPGAGAVSLAQELATAVRASPLRYSAAADRFVGLPEPYVAYLLGSLHAAFSNGSDLAWSPILRLCERVSGSGAPGERTPVQRSGGREMILLLRAGLDRMPPAIPIGEREHVWRVIESSLSGNAPEADGGSIAMEEARASARAQALATAVSYGEWVRSHDRDADLADVFGALDGYLEPGEEPSLLVRAVYGTEFRRLSYLDGAWAAAAASRIFPATDTDQERWDAAWGAYLDTAAPISRDVCGLLSDQYQLAIDRVGTSSAEPAELRDARLGRHLIAEFWSGEITLDSGDQLIRRFYQRASTAVREQMTQYIGWNLLNPEVGADQAVLSRLTRLWEERLAVASPSADRGELVGFGDWFASGRFDDDWSLRQLGRVITLAGDVKPDILVLRRLAEIAPVRAQLCLDIAGEWVRQLPDDAWLFSAREEYLRRILEVGLASPDPSTRALAGEIINRTGRQWRLRDLVHH